MHYEHSKSEQTTDQHRYHIVHSHKKAEVKVEIVKGKRFSVVTQPENILFFLFNIFKFKSSFILLIQLSIKNYYHVFIFLFTLLNITNTCYYSHFLTVIAKYFHVLLH